ncbi:hypothetical protein BT96DRAFT_840098, partial [Gymnopus androsaceus JB14]
DMKHSTFPSWMSPAPSQWGLARTGKLGGDEWKVVVSIHLVVTLIRLWSREAEESRKYKMLTNFVDLVKAGHILLLRGTTAELRAEYDLYIERYLREVLALYPDVNLAPNHHYSLHMSEFLESMGPGHPRSTPVFERTNHKLQLINKNRHAGEL